tara:strand:+ start:1761 stop:2591 length:831 start_codon:yes stop_codon:yes gene_type:complete
MKNNLILILLFLSSIFGQKKVVTIGGAVTETVFELGAGNLVVGVDISSVLPSKVKSMPQVGYVRSINAEGVLSKRPDLILATSDIGPTKVVDKISKYVEFEIFESPHSFDEIISLVEKVSETLSLVKQGDKIKSNLINLNRKVSELKSSYLKKPRIAFFMNPVLGSYNAAGSGTKADYLVSYIGGENVFSDDFNNYSSVTIESIIYENPDIIIIGSVMGQDQKELYSLFEKKQFKHVNAILNEQVIYIDIAEYLTFGPSFCEYALLLIDKIQLKSR